MRTGNPTLNASVFDQFYQENQAVSSTVMTISGTVWKTLILLGLCVGSASFTWGMVFGPDPSKAVAWAIGGAIGGLVLAFIAGFAPKTAPITGPLYAMAEGLFLGALTAIAEAKFPGIGLQATAATFGTLFALLMAYQSGLIKATENFKLMVTAATGGVAVLYLVSFVLGTFFQIRVPFIHEAGLIGIGFSLFVVVLAALNLVLDFEYIENAAAMGLPKHVEWYAAFGLMVTLVWLYVEILRLLIKLNSSRE